MDQRSCLTCKGPMTDKSGQAKYCSSKCQVVDYHKLEPKKETKCEICDTMFMPRTRKKTRFCSNRCRYLNALKESGSDMTERDCQQCGEKFRPRRSFQMYCSRKCRIWVMNFCGRNGIPAADYNATPTPESERIPQTELDAEKAAQEHFAEAQRKFDEENKKANEIVEDQGNMELALCVRCCTRHISVEIDTLCKMCQVLEEQEKVQAAIAKVPQQGSGG